jgi:ATP-dependent protease HslVU (ClpYQ) peptidase subunit
MNNTQLVAMARALKKKLNVVVREIAVSDAGGAAAAFAMLQGLEKDLETRRARALGSVGM